MLEHLHRKTIGLFGDSPKTDIKRVGFSAATSFSCFVKATAGYVGQLGNAGREIVGKVVPPSSEGCDIEEGQSNGNQKRHSHSRCKFFGKADRIRAKGVGFVEAIVTQG